MSNNIWQKHLSGESIISTTVQETKIGRTTLIVLEQNSCESTSNENIDQINSSLYQSNKKGSYQPTQDNTHSGIKKGRKKKNQDYSTELTSIHSKLFQDNIKRKIKTHFHNFIISFLNNEIRKEWNMQKFKLRKMDSKITQNITISYNKRLLEMPIREIINNVSSKFRDKSTNENFINKILKYKPNLASLLNMTYETFFTDYYLQSTPEMFKDSGKDDSFLTHLETIKEHDGDEYRQKYYNHSFQFVDFFKTCKQRKRKSHI